MGDPIETNTAGEFYARKDGYLIVGSVKGVSEHVRLSLSEWNELYLYLPVSEHVRLTTRVG